MKYLNKTFVWLTALCAFSFTFVACNDDEEPVQQIEDFELAAEQMRVKIGADNMQAIEVATGAGEYQAYVLDETIARIVEQDGQVYVEGLHNGQTTVIVSDAASRYRRIAVQVYTTENMVLSDTDFNLEAPLGFNATAAASVVEGNGEYTIESDNENVVATIDEETGEITISGRGRMQEYTAVVTVSDCTGITATINVTVVGSTTPFTAADLEEIKASTDGTLVFDGDVSVLYRYGNKIAAVQSNGKMRVGIDHYSYYRVHVEFNGYLSVGVKADGTFSSNYGWRYTNQPCDVEVIKNDGTRVWIIFSWIDTDAESLHRGYIIHNL